MIDGKGKHRCDGESEAGKWCGKPASWEIQTEYCWLHYCNRCAPARKQDPARYFKPKPGSDWRLIHGIRYKGAR